VISYYIYYRYYRLIVRRRRRHDGYRDGVVFVRRQEFPARIPMAVDVCRRGVRPGLPGGHVLLRLASAVLRHRPVHVHRLAAVLHRILARDPEEDRRDGRRHPRSAVVRQHGPADLSRDQLRGKHLSRRRRRWRSYSHVRNTRPTLGRAHVTAKYARRISIIIICVYI